VAGETAAQPKPAAFGRFSGDVVVPVQGRDLTAEVKARADGFRELYGWLDRRDVLIVKADRQDRRPWG
jgi:hypothetical protein